MPKCEHIWLSDAPERDKEIDAQEKPQSSKQPSELSKV